MALQPFAESDSASGLWSQQDLRKVFVNFMRVLDKVKQIYIDYQAGQRVATARGQINFVVEQVGYMPQMGLIKKGFSLPQILTEEDRGNLMERLPKDIEVKFHGHHVDVRRI